MRWQFKKKKRLNSDGTEVGLMPKDERPKPPRLGDTKIKRKFLWFPKKIKNYWYWLEFCDFTYEWKTYYEYDCNFGYVLREQKEGWRVVKIKTKQR